MSNKKGKILFTISSYPQYKTYIQTQALKEIQDRVVFIVNPKVIEMKLDFGVFSDRIIPYSYPDRKNVFHRHVFNLNSYINRTRHNVFLIRTLWFTRRQKKIYGIFSLPVLRNIVKFLFLQRAKDKILFELVKKINPSMIILPSHAFDGKTFELVRIAKKMKIPSFMIAENWDTLSTKTIFTFDPDYLGVWSQQQIEHAVNIRGFPKERTFILGTPKYTNFIKTKNTNQASPYSFRYALFSGVQDLFDEIGALKRIDEIIDRNNIDLKVVYRPTPVQHTRSCPDVFFEYDFKHVVLDTPAKAYYKKSATWDMTDSAFKPEFFPDPNYYSKLLLNAEFIICPHSTMLIRASLLGKRTYLLCYDDGVHDFGGSRWAFETQKHLIGVERLSNVRMVRKIEDLEKIFVPGDELKEPIDPLDVDYFVSKEATINYVSNLKRVVDEILAKS